MKFKGKDMGKFGAKQGENIQVLGMSRQWLETPRVFIAMHKGRYLCEQVGNDEEVEVWPTARAMPTKPEPTPFTYETWPKKPVWIRRQHWGKGSMLVVAVMKDGIAMGAENKVIPFRDLGNHTTTMSLDHCATWQPCHYVPESG